VGTISRHPQSWIPTERLSTGQGNGERTGIFACSRRSSQTCPLLARKLFELVTEALSGEDEKEGAVERSTRSTNRVAPAARTGPRGSRARLRVRSCPPSHHLTRAKVPDSSKAIGQSAYVVSTIEMETRCMLAWFVFAARAEATGRRQHAK
jgi:hypothetical protein